MLNEIVEIVHTQIALSTSDKYRVPPLVLMRFARGGKTFTISKTFDKLKEQGRVSPILISFNGSGEQAFRRREGETQSEAILRLIAAQLSDYSVVDARQLVADRAVLDVCLGDNVVLLIDELNNLGTALDAEAAELLRTMFLDRPGRFLAFTSHIPVSIEPDLQLAKASSFIRSSSVIPVSLRGVSIVNMSSANSLIDLRSMPRACEELIEEQAAWLGYIPSIIYCTMNDEGRLGAFSPKQRFQQMHIAIEPGEEANILKRFVRELLSGERDSVVSGYFGAFVNVGADSSISYPLCYVKEIFKKLKLNAAIEDSKL